MRTIPHDWVLSVVAQGRSFQQGTPSLGSKLPGCSHGAEPGLSLDIDFPMQNGSDCPALECANLVEIMCYKSPIYLELWEYLYTRKQLIQQSKIIGV